MAVGSGRVTASPVDFVAATYHRLTDSRSAVAKMQDFEDYAEITTR